MSLATMHVRFVPSLYAAETRQHTNKRSVAERTDGRRREKARDMEKNKKILIWDRRRRHRTGIAMLLCE